MDRKNFAEVRPAGEDSFEPIPDIHAAERVMNNIMDSVGAARPSRSLEEVVSRVKKRRRISNFLTVMEIVLIATILLAGLALFMRGYIANVTVKPNNMLTETVAPPHSAAVSYRDGALEMRLVPGEFPLDYTTATATRLSDGAAAAVEFDVQTDTVYITCPRQTDDYSFTICDAQGIPYTFTLHIVTGN